MPNWVVALRREEEDWIGSSSSASAERKALHANQVVADMVDEVLAHLAAVRARWSGESFGNALGAIVRTEAGRQLQELRDGPHGSERADEWQEHLVRSRAEARADLITDTSF